MYEPKPLDLTKVELPSELNELMDVLAENVHENWAAQRMSEGWTYGEKRDDEKRTTPCLVPYCELSEEEKAYDKITAEQTIKTIIACGYKISQK